MVDRLTRTAKGIRSAISGPNISLQRRNDSTATLFAAWIFWLVTARLIIPGWFDYGAGAMQAAKNDAVSSTITWLLFAGASAWMVFGRMDAGRQVLRATSPYFIGLLVLAICSVAWSIDPGATARRLIRLVIVVFACLAITIYGWRERRFQEVVRPVVTWFLFGSLIFGLIAPDLAIETPIFPHTEHYWHGLAITKNALGAIASTGTILWLHAWASREVRPLTGACGTLLSFALMALARAATYMMATSLACALLLLMLGFSRRNRRYIPYIIGALVIATIAYSLAVLDVVPGLDWILSPITALTGKDRSFTNRALIWQITREHIGFSPIIGTGYGGFWVTAQPGTQAYDFFVPRTYFYPGECHDGYLEVMNDLGLVGLLLLFGYLANYLRSALKLLKTNYTQAALYLAILFQQLLSGLTESNWLWLDAEMIILTLATMCLARHRLERRPIVGSQLPLARRAQIS